MRTPRLKPGQHRKGPKTKIARVLYFANGVRAMEMRTSGMSWGLIAETLGLQGDNAPNTALKMARDAREKLEQETAEELRLVHHSRYEYMYEKLGHAISRGNVRGIEVATKVLESDAKLMGINADAEKEQGNFQPILIQIRANPADEAAVKRIAAKNLIIEQSEPSKLLPPPDSSV